MKPSVQNGTVLTARNSRRLAAKKYWQEHWQYYVLLLPAVIFIIIFAYVPMYGAQIAFRDYKVKLGFWGSEWVGLEHFKRFVTSSNFWPLLRNTLSISLYSLVAGFPAPIILAFMLNELQSSKLRKTIQMITYAPHFISAVAVCGLIHLFTQREAGVINLFITLLGGEGIDFLSEPSYFSTIYVVSGIWQELGWGTIIYLAALSGVDPQIVEASIIDGASRVQKIWYIDIPTILPTIIILLILNSGSILNVGYEKVLLLQTPLNMGTSDIISTYVYRLGIEDAQFSYTTAIGLFNSVVNLVMLSVVNYVSKRLSGSSLW
ncbi:MAG: sugar ABC transporter permease [Ruminococcaceae bacterium]|nr:sugar ABC transporter permease [Oscillospiraceae bacterium]